MKKLRYGIIGVGTQGSVYANFFTGRPAFEGGDVPECPPHCALGALCDIDPAKEEKCKENYPNYPFYKDWKEMALSGDVDAVVTTVPHYLHPEIAIFCIENKLPVLVEKPAGVYSKQVRLMNECAAANPDVPFAVLFNQRTNKLYKKIKEIVESGELGQIRRSNWIINTWWRPDSYYQQSDWRATWGGEGGGVLVNQAPHQLDMWDWICGTPTKIYAKIIFGAHRDIVVDNDVTIVTEYANGATGCFITTTHDINGTDRFEIDFDKGKIVVEDSKKAKVYRFKKSEDEFNKTMTMADLSKITSSNTGAGQEIYTEEEFENTDGWGIQHLTVLENFACHVLEGKELIAPGREGINGVNLANGALLSAWLGKEINFPVDENLFIEELNKRIEEEGKYPKIDL